MFNIICLDFNPPSCSVSTCPLPLSLILMESMLYLRGLHGFIFKLSGLFLSSFYFALNPKQYSFQLIRCMFQLWKFPLCLFCIFHFSLCVSLCSPLSYWAVRRAVLISPFVSFIASIIWGSESAGWFFSWAMGHAGCWAQWVLSSMFRPAVKSLRSVWSSDFWFSSYVWWIQNSHYCTSDLLQH